MRTPNRFPLDQELMNIPLKEQLKYFDRLVDKHDHDCYLASQELNERTRRGGQPLSRSQWLELIKYFIQQSEITEHDYFQPI
tara:strand:- start:1148 stop:1393 length:246 start_codon:yes stop_codon:yes gene_type:complete